MKKLLLLSILLSVAFLVNAQNKYRDAIKALPDYPQSSSLAELQQYYNAMNALYDKYHIQEGDDYEKEFGLPEISEEEAMQKTMALSKDPQIMIKYNELFVQFSTEIAQAYNIKLENVRIVKTRFENLWNPLVGRYSNAYYENMGVEDGDPAKAEAAYSEMFAKGTPLFNEMFLVEKKLINYYKDASNYFLTTYLPKVHELTDAGTNYAMPNATGIMEKEECYKHLLNEINQRIDVAKWLFEFNYYKKNRHPANENSIESSLN